MNTSRKRPGDETGWDQHYIDGELPWDSGEPDLHLSGVVERYGISPDRALEIGCGTGTNSIWLAKQGFEVTALDVSPTAIAKAEVKIAAAKVGCRLLVGDFLTVEFSGDPFGFIYDRGCLHVFDDAQERARFAARVASLLAPQGIWHSLIGSTDGPPRDTGPPRRSAMEIVAALEPRFEILELTSTTFDRVRHNQARAWVLVARRRAFYPEE